MSSVRRSCRGNRRLRNANAWVVGGCTTWVAAASTGWSRKEDGPRVTLTFHFWSGATVTYQVTKSGDSVTGTTA